MCVDIKINGISNQTILLLFIQYQYINRERVCVCVCVCDDDDYDDAVVRFDAEEG